MPVNAKFTLTGDDYEQYLRYFYRHTRTGRRHMRRLYAIGVAVFLLFVWWLYDDPKFGANNPGYFATYLVASGAILGGGYWYLINRLWPALAQAAVRMSPQKGMFTETSLSIDEEGMDVHTPAGKGRLEWSQVREIADTDDALYLFTGGINAFIIPKRAFTAEDDASETLRLVLRAIAPDRATS